MPDGSVPLLISIIVLIAFSAFFSATETAFNCANRIKLKSLAANGNKRAGKVLDLSENRYDKLLTTILIGNNIVNLSASTISALLFVKLLSGTSLNPSIISTAVITVAVLIFGEITPKYVAKACAESLSMAVYPIISMMIVVFYPLSILFSGWKTLIEKIFRLNSERTITEEEIITMVEEAEEDGTIKKEETNLIRSVIEFDDLNAEDILVPRVNICAVEKKSTLDEIKRKFEECKFSRIPVYDTKIDSVVGIIHEKDFYRIYSSGGSLEEIMQKPFFTNGKTKISKLLKNMQKDRNHMAIVIDEYGGTSGLVTMEDILEELVGEIYDEHDSKIEYIKQAGENTFIVSGETPVSKMFKFFDIEEDESSESNTVSGWIIENIGDFPDEGRKITYKDMLELEVIKTDKKIIRDIKVKKLS